ncbi:SPK domain-containing protein [Caenorhabditis elegans]|uniref:SPK domain-containing protein n=1 Tax=Caenorhabditis elegans TaxID=6239 RepID=Q23479_CAEEL|nr:SPK domain-containing protein [Caenorhabditis elegans]CCD69743.1 SPK domain-containing protein [Caenorhabditis elegans]|eukprot:NP_508263.1 Uncharacterized protein CELE_ZK402.2 [Caenorhabditis elegans]
MNAVWWQVRNLAPWLGVGNLAPHTTADDVRLMTFLVEKTKEANEPLVATKVFMEFGKKENARCSDGAYYRKFHKKLAPNMDQLDNYSIESRLRVMLGLAGKVSDDFLTQ